MNPHKSSSIREAGLGEGFYVLCLLQLADEGTTRDPKSPRMGLGQEAGPEI